MQGLFDSMQRMVGCDARISVAMPRVSVAFQRRVGCYAKISVAMQRGIRSYAEKNRLL